MSIKYAHYAVPDSLSLLFLILAIGSSLKIISKDTLKEYLFCGLFCGLSISAKFSGLISLVFLFCAYLLSANSDKAASFRKVISAFLIAFTVFFILSPYHILYFQEALRDFTKYSLDKGYLQGSSFYLRGVFNYFFILLPGVFGMFGLLSAGAGLVLMYLKNTRRALLLSLPAILYLFIVGKDSGTIQNALPVLPVLAILAAYFIFRFKEMRLNKTIIYCLVILCLVPNLFKAAVFDYFLLKKDTRILAEEWLTRNAKDGSRIGFERYTPYDLDYPGNPKVRNKFDAVYFIPSLSIYPASYYKDAGYDYIVTSGFREDDYVFSCRKSGLCQGADNYATYELELREVSEFRAPLLFKLTALSLPWGTWPHNPDIRIYQVKGDS